MTRTHYEILGVPPTASASDIKAAYRSLCKTAHPDMGGNPALFGIIQESYDVLKEPSSRSRYDAELAGPPTTGSASGSSRAGPSRSRPGPDEDPRPWVEDVQREDVRSTPEYQQAQRRFEERYAPKEPLKPPRFPIAKKLFVAACGVGVFLASIPVGLLLGQDLGLGVDSMVGNSLFFFVASFMLSGLPLRRAEMGSFPPWEKALLFVVPVLLFTLLPVLVSLPLIVALLVVYVLVARLLLSDASEEKSSAG